MADPNLRSPLGPTPEYPERMGTFYERKIAPNVPGQKGPLRFQEGIGTDTDIPRDFMVGATQGYYPAPGSNNRPPNVYVKPASETLKQRAHVGSAAWVDAPTFVADFANAAFGGGGQAQYEMVVRDGSHYMRKNATVVNN